MDSTKKAPFGRFPINELELVLRKLMDNQSAT